MSADDQKRAAGEAAAGLVRDDMVVGLGTGSTAAWFVKALASRGLAGVRGVATSVATEALARSLGLAILDLNDAPPIDLTVDGADEIGPGLALIKGAGAALLREKLVWEASSRCVVIAEAAKPVAGLGAAPLPIEVVAFGHVTTARRIVSVLEQHAIAAAPRLRMAGAALLVTDSGNLIYDVVCGAIPDPAGLGAALKSVTGVVEHGLFIGLADLALIGRDDGVTSLTL